MKFWILTGLLIIGAASLAAQGQSDNPDDSCYEARAWHLHQALRYSQAPDQDYHLKAAEAAEELATGCQGWDSDARAMDSSGDSSAAGLDDLQSHQDQAQANRVQA